MDSKLTSNSAFFDSHIENNLENTYKPNTLEKAQKIEKLFL